MIFLTHIPSYKLPLHYAAMVILYFFIIGCNKKEVKSNNELILNLPDHFPNPVYSFEGNDLSVEGIELGRKLFYNPILSKDSTIHCGTCHAQEHAFADHNTALSFGVEGKSGRRNSPSIVNMIFYPNFNWDGGINHLEVQPIAPITDSLEMGERLNTVIDKLNQHPQYPERFNKVFNNPNVNSQNLLKALTQFMAVMNSTQSKYDAYKKGAVMLSNREQQGLQIFKSNCATCHSGELFSNFSFKNNGISELMDNDLGRYEITQNPADKWKYRVPSLRNVALTYPYMLNGSVFSLKEVIDLYCSEGNEHRDPSIPTQGYNFTEAEKEALIQFLITLNDFKMLANPDLSPPFEF